MGKKKITYGVTHSVTAKGTKVGARVGQGHPNAKLTDEQVDIIRDLYEEGMVGYRALAKLFGVSRNTIKDICNYRRRAATPDVYKTVCVDSDD